ILEEALRRYHDRVVAAAGTLYFPVPKMPNAAEQQLAEALIAVSGDMPCYCSPVGGIIAPAQGIPELLKLKAAHPALFQNSIRRRIATDQDAHVYATLRVSFDGTERVLAVFNFRGQPLRTTVDASAIHGSQFLDLASHEEYRPQGDRMVITLPPLAWRLFEVQTQAVSGIAMRKAIRDRKEKR
ncbi:MAG: alpha-glucosidase C-terminal domain-containing protein, partial [Acidobacteriaceae bacterium]